MRMWQEFKDELADKNTGYQRSKYCSVMLIFTSPGLLDGTTRHVKGSSLWIWQESAVRLKKRLPASQGSPPGFQLCVVLAPSDYEMHDCRWDATLASAINNTLHSDLSSVAGYKCFRDSLESRLTHAFSLRRARVWSALGALAGSWIIGTLKPIERLSGRLLS